MIHLTHYIPTEQSPKIAHAKAQRRKGYAIFFAPLRLCVKCLRLLPLLALLLLPQPATAQDAPPRFGIIESTENPRLASQLGAGWTRLRFQWAEVQPTGPNEWQPRSSDEQLAVELAAGREVVGLLIGIPDWARDANKLPRGLYAAPDDSANLWANFVREASSRYAGRIDRWIIWNEPDISDPTTPGHTWDGTIKDFYQLQKIAYLVIKETNPSAQVHLAAFTHFWDPTYFGRFLDVVVADPTAAAHNHYFDVATAHLYFQPNSIYDILQGFRADMSQRGLEKPIWLVETNAPPLDDASWPVPNWTLSVRQNEQAAFVPQALASALAAGAERIALYKLQDTEDDRAANPEPFGLARLDGSRRPAFTTTQVALRYFGNVQGGKRERWDAVGQIRLDQGGFTTTVLFARLPAPQRARVVATSKTAVLASMWGDRHTIRASNGFYNIDLQAALCTQPIGDYCMIGGTVLYLVQSADGDEPPPAPPLPTAPAASTQTPKATATLLPIPTASSTPTATPTVTPSPTATATSTATATPTVTPTLVLPPTATNTPIATPGESVVETAVIHPSPPPAPTRWLLVGGVGLLILGGLWFRRAAMKK